MRSFVWLLAAMVSFLSACIEPITFEEEGIDFLVVDGFISNEPKEHRIRLSRAADYSGDFVSEIINAEVFVFDDLDNSTQLKYSNFGYYETPAHFAGIEGRSYTLKITTPEGEEYVSQPQKLHSQGSLDSVYFSTIDREYLNEENKILNRKGIEYYINYTLPAEKQSYLMWRWEATYEVRTPFSIDTLEAPPFNCYVDENSTDFIKLINSAELASKKIVKDHFYFVVPDPKYWYTYSMNVKQYTISKEIYEFFQGIKKQQANTGTIFDPTPASINGNIRNINDPDEIVLGYFGAFGVEDKRTFVQGRDIPKTSAEWVALEDGLYPECGVENIPTPHCFDCRIRPKSSPEPPPYWE